ncbi:uncharacterized protein LOC124810619 isoform X2 [Hydra vulgaris]|uniref:uncharacterized protein LOC124810619 isoform X2 n=1 Tax=Hydra vulgaris TaxID=6087 RepID=UPI001F5E7F6D|nr:uncharacterized protein LOC124810619 isoform X2 [Hydra vulgaris]
MDDKKYKDILLKIAVNLLDRDVEAIKFYYSKQIGDADLERITTPIKLIQILEQRMILGIDNYSSFVEVLTKIGRNDLVIYFFEISSSPNKDTNISFKKDRLSKSDKRKDYHDLFIECFYESQSSFNDEIKSIVDKRWRWKIWIDNRKTSYLTSCENYFINHYVKSGRKLWCLRVNKNILSDEEKKLLVQCSTNVCNVIFYRPNNFEGWKPKDKIEVLGIWISDYLITKKDFEENFLPWINLCEELYLKLHKDIDFIKELYEWIRCSNVEKFRITYRGESFENLDD